MRLGRDSHSFRDRLAVVMPGSTERLTRCRDFRNVWKKPGPGSLSPRHWNGARLCRRPAAARGKFEGVGSLPRAAAGRGRHSRAPFQQRGRGQGEGPFPFHRVRFSGAMSNGKSKSFRRRHILHIAHCSLGIWDHWDHERSGFRTDSGLPQIWFPANSR